MTECKVIVCGGRDYADQAAVDELLGNVRREDLVIIEGGATGADALARDWARRNEVATRSYPADWRTHGRKAGPIRNQTMLDREQPNLVIAFPGGRGTADMLRRADRAGVTVILA